MQFSEKIPWVDVSGNVARCTVCGQHGGGSPGDIHSFASRHSAHTAPRGFLGLGDVIAKVAKPIAAAFGKKPCSPCEARRNALNHARVRRFW